VDFFMPKRANIEKPPTRATLIRPRFSIAGLLVLIMYCGLAFAALKQSTDLWQSAVFSFTSFLLVTAALLAIHRGGSRRHFWLGFLLFGTVYLALSLYPPTESRLLSSKGFELVQSVLHSQPTSYDIVVTAYDQIQHTDVLSVPATQKDFRYWNASTGKFVALSGGAPENFASIGHSLVTLLFAWSGGIFSRWLGRPPTAADEPRIEQN
jgi:hypothetical protein